MTTKTATGVKLQDPKLFRQASYIHGAWVDSTAHGLIEVDNPATGEIVGTVPRLGKTETRSRGAGVSGVAAKNGEGARRRHAPVVRADDGEPGGSRSPDDDRAGQAARRV